MMKRHCGECDSRLYLIGRLLFCAKPGCSMYGRAVEAEGDAVPERARDERTPEAA